MAAQRALVPLDPWRYYEMGRVAEERFDGDCLDVSSPKLLPSLLQHEGQGRWTGVDLFEQEIEAWKAVDPDLRLEVADATKLPYPDASFDHVLCVSVVEHIPGDGDSAAMAEFFRVLRPGGRLHLTTDVAPATRDILLEDRIYGEASQQVEGGVFFARNYSARGPRAAAAARRPGRSSTASSRASAARSWAGASTRARRGPTCTGRRCGCARPATSTSRPASPT